MARVLKIGVLFLLSITLNTIETNAQEATKEHKDSLKSFVEEYYRLNIAVFQANSTIEDIDTIFSMFTDDFIYIHPKYGGVYSRENLQNGYVRNQKNGGYNGSIVDIKIINMIIGLNAVVVEKRFIKKTKDGIPEKGDSEMTLFEFEAGKIFKIFEYW
jgi:hypothetical protein